MFTRAPHCHLFSLSVATVLTCGLPLSNCVRTGLAQEERRIENPKNIDLQTSDGVKLKAVFYPGNREKETIPVILLHEWDSYGQSMWPMAAHLQRSLGCAVLVPDLRGHGGSKRVIGDDEDLDRDRWRSTEVAALTKDIEACKKYLIQENNEGNLNIDLLTLVGRGEACIHILQWTLQDWSYPVLGNVKQGQDVKAVVLISPSRAFKGLSVVSHLKSPLFSGRGMDPLPVLVAGDIRKESRLRDAENIYDNLERGRARRDDPDDLLEYFRFRMIKGRAIVDRKSGDLPLDDVVSDFINRRVESRAQEFRWQDRAKK